MAHQADEHPNPQSILDRTAEGVVVADEHGRLVLINAVGEQLLGRGRDRFPPGQ